MLFEMCFHVVKGVCVGVGEGEYLLGQILKLFLKISLTLTLMILKCINETILSQTIGF